MSPHGLLLWQTPILKYQIYIPSNNQLYQSTINRSLSTKRKSFTPQAGPKDDQDWDRAFADELKKRRGVRPSSPKPEQNGNSSNAPPPRFTQTRQAWNAGPAQNDITKIEQILVNIWIQNSFFLAGAAITMFFLGLLLFAGPPPTDSRCTLPWC